MTQPAFRRILLKLSGEALMGDLPYGADPERIADVAKQVKACLLYTSPSPRDRS